MYVANLIKGIGEVIEITETHVVAYFEEKDETKSFLKSLVKLYNTEEEADEYLNPTMTEEECNAILAEIQDDKRIVSEGQEAFFAIEKREIARAELMMKNK